MLMYVGLALLGVFGVYLLVKYVWPNIPARRRRHGWGAIQQATDQAVGIFDRTYPDDPLDRSIPKIGRNDPCPCGSGRKFKRCHGRQA